MGYQGAGRRDLSPFPPSSCPQTLPGEGLWRNKAWCLVLHGSGERGTWRRWGALEEAWEP